jgi:hypothetical protein
VTRAADRLRTLGLEVPAVSVGSTPTALHARSLDGVTDMRPGVYTLFDLAQVALGSCTVEDIAMSVLATVVGHTSRAGLMLIDAGALALSKDVSGNKGGLKVGYGLVCDATGGRLDGVLRSVALGRYRRSGGMPLIGAANCAWSSGSTGRCLTRVLAGSFPRKLSPFQLVAGRTGRGTNPPPQLGHTLPRIPSTHAAQKVHS